MITFFPYPLSPVRADANPTISNPAQFSTVQVEKYAEAMPYWIWLVLPRLFPEYLVNQGGYLALGFQWQAGKENPEGIIKHEQGEKQVELNCSTCHTNFSTSEVSSSNPNLLRISNINFNHQRYHQFLVNCVHDPRFTADFILPAIEYNHRLSWVQKQRYRWQFIPQIKKHYLAQSETV